MIQSTDALVKKFDRLFINGKLALDLRYETSEYCIFLCSDTQTIYATLSPNSINEVDFEYDYESIITKQYLLDAITYCVN